MDDALLAAHVDAIHAAPRDDFVSERDRRVRELRADGHREEATALKARRKPTVPAWAVNQLARHHAAAVDELVEAGGQLRTAQLRATSGKGADGLRQATRRVRDLASELTRVAQELLADAGAASTHLDEVQQTLFAAAIDPDLHETLCRGVFTRPVEAAGFGVMAGLAAVPDATRGGDVGEDATPTDAPDDDAAQRDAEAREERARRDARRRALEQQRGDLQRSLVRQQRRVDRARTQAEQLQARADEAAATARDEEQAQDRLDRELADVDSELAALDEAGVQPGT